MKKRLFAALLPLLLPALSCSDNDNGKERPWAFSVSAEKADFLEGIDPPLVVQILSGNGWYGFTVDDDKIVDVDLLDGDYEYGAFKFTPKSVGSTVVTLTDIIGYDFKKIPVNVYDAGLSLALIDTQSTVEIDDPVLKREIEQNLLLGHVFSKDIDYLMSNKEQGLMYAFDEGTFKGDRKFGHTTDNGKTFLVITSGSGETATVRTFRVVNDKKVYTHSYSSFYGLTITGTRSEQEVKFAEVWYSEDLTEKYREQERYREVTSVQVTYRCSYEFAPFVSRE